MPHRPGLAPALGLRAGADGLVIPSQTAVAEERCFSPSLEVHFMFRQSAKILSRVLGFLPLHRRTARCRTAPRRARLAVEALEQRCLPSSYSITDIGVIAGVTSDGGSLTLSMGPVSGINNAPAVQVSGSEAPQTALLSPEAFVWDSIHGVQLIGTLNNKGNSTAVGINDAGQVVGRSWTTTYYPPQLHRFPKVDENGFVWSSSSGMTGLGSGTDPIAINNSGEIAGNVGGEASLWNGKKWTQLGVLPGGTFSRAFGINDYGQVAGWSASDTTSFYEALLWSPSSPHSTSGAMIDLGSFTSNPGGSYAAAVNSQGWVTGQASNLGYFGGAGHAFLWKPASPNGTTGSMMDLGSLAVNSEPGASQSWGLAINSSGVVVGESNPAGANGEGQTDAVVWQPGANGSYTLSDLNNLIPSGTGWTLTRADAVNDSGQIVAEATNGTSYHALLLTPAGPSTPFARAANGTRQTTGASPLPASSAGHAFAPLPAPPLAGSGIAPPTVGVSPRNGPATPSAAPLPLPSFTDRLTPADQADPFRFDSAPSKVARAAADRVFAGLGAEPPGALAGDDLALAGLGSDDLMPAAARA
jgi:probable HAF family extracellular repeat protein